METCKIILLQEKKYKRNKNATICQDMACFNVSCPHLK